MKKFVSLFLCVIMILSVALPAHATTNNTDYAGNGYCNRDIKYNGKTYSAGAGANMDKTYGAYVAAACEAEVYVSFTSYNVVFDTQHHGYLPVAGISSSAQFNASNHYSVNSRYVVNPYGMNEVIRLYELTCTVTISADTDYVLPIHLHQ